MLAGLLTTWTTARQASLVVEEYSGVTAVDITLAGNHHFEFPFWDNELFGDGGSGSC